MNINKMWVLHRLKERSTYVGLVFVCAAIAKHFFAINLTRDQETEITNAAFALAGSILVTVADKNQIVINTSQANLPQNAADQITINNSQPKG